MTTNSEMPTTSSDKRNFDGSVALLLAGSIYLLLAIAFNQAIFQTDVYAIPASVLGGISAILGLYAAYALNKGNASRGIFAAALTAVVLGFAITLLVFLIGLIPISTGASLLGITGSAWVIYALAGYWLYRNSRQ